MTDSLIPASSLITASAVRSGRWKWLAAAIPACALMATAQAAPILALDFDANSGYYYYGYSYAFYGDPGYGYHDLGSYLSQDTAIYPGIGIGGSNALRISADSTRLPAQLPPDHTYEGFNFAIVEDAGLPALTSPLLSDYTLTLSGRADGQNSAETKPRSWTPRSSRPTAPSARWTGTPTRSLRCVSPMASR